MQRRTMIIKKVFEVGDEFVLYRQDEGKENIRFKIDNIYLGTAGTTYDIYVDSTQIDNGKKETNLMLIMIDLLNRGFICIPGQENSNINQFLRKEKK